MEATDEDVKAIVKKEFDEYINANYPSDLKERIKQHIINEKRAKIEARKGNNFNLKKINNYT